jgi:hypothetical protein
LPISFQRSQRTTFDGEDSGGADAGAAAERTRAATSSVIQLASDLGADLKDGLIFRFIFWMIIRINDNIYNYIDICVYIDMIFITILMTVLPFGSMLKFSYKMSYETENQLKFK